MPLGLCRPSLLIADAMTRERDLTHCRVCGRKWGGTTECHCTRCHTHFGGSEAFASHLVGDGCLSVADMLAPDDKTGRVRYQVVNRAHGPVVCQWRESEHPAAVPQP
jgi:hypothetical protein